MPNAGRCAAPDVDPKLLHALAESTTAVANAPDSERHIALMRLKNALFLLGDSRFLGAGELSTAE
jgi:hypothetical protein